MLSLMVMIAFFAIVATLGAVAVVSVRRGHGDHATDRDGDGVPYDGVEAVGRTEAEERRARAGGLDSLGDSGGTTPNVAEVEAARRIDEATRRRRDDRR
ncbi:hypothetical protein [Nocardioides albus]|uniref:Uncharacterized protein n=1 Tax=Nocardioides albus TaxID=1841 RepID=A0A7W5F8E5_9ACTN|nr:hypothetical protein [Nocardioides albus]MBB3088976.1 hypothetical protein [Nocardioides albus]GGU15076.1 hypothetical protein GCM10007979_12120 [Nocardioides albus]